MVNHLSFDLNTPAAVDIVPTPGPGLRLVIIKIEFTADALALVSIHEGADGTGKRFFYGNVGVGGGAILEFDENNEQALASNTPLKITATAGNLRGVTYYKLAA